VADKINREDSMLRSVPDPTLIRALLHADADARAQYKRHKAPRSIELFNGPKEHYHRLMSAVDTYKPYWYFQVHEELHRRGLIKNTLLRHPSCLFSIGKQKIL
jgi:hypothetical protein